MKKILKISALAFGAAFIVVLTIAFVRFFTFKSRQIAVQGKIEIKIDERRALQNLSGALQIKTISSQYPTESDLKPFFQLHEYLKKIYPRLHAVLKQEKIGASLLYTWEGTDRSAKPILLMGHQDVVPVTSPKRWKYPPFSGINKDGYIWGRGAQDNKNTLMGALEAVEHLIGEGFQPKRTIYLAFGHDEETGGTGARATADLLEKRGIRLATALDEGGFITHGILPAKAPVALIGIAEKGYISLKLTAISKGGHSSAPSPRTAVGTLARAVAKLEDNQYPGVYNDATRLMFEYLGPELGAGQRFVFSNVWLLKPILLRQLFKAPSTNAMVRTTTAATMFRGSLQENVLPTRAEAVVNFRIMIGDTIAGVTERSRKIISDDSITIEHTKFRAEPSPVSDVNTPAFRALHETTVQMFPGTLIAPYLLPGGSDSRHYVKVADQIYRFIPQRLTKEDLDRIHGTDERIGTESYATLVKFYIQIIKRMHE